MKGKLFLECPPCLVSGTWLRFKAPDYRHIQEQKEGSFTQGPCSIIGETRHKLVTPRNEKPHKGICNEEDRAHEMQAPNSDRD